MIHEDKIEPAIVDWLKTLPQERAEKLAQRMVNDADFYLVMGTALATTGMLACAAVAVESQDDFYKVESVVLFEALNHAQHGVECEDARDLRIFYCENLDQIDTKDVIGDKVGREKFEKRMQGFLATYRKFRENITGEWQSIAADTTETKKSRRL